MPKAAGYSGSTEAYKELCERDDIDLDYRYMSKALVEELHAGHIKVNCWTCNDSGTAGELIAMGVDFITTNILE